ncbi:AlpA family transcriptional regulator [Gemmobacter caeni]|uniref:AlpA family transcriptional regulator n=1 Tax=Gemmobacter caeni TaxID=589035 RepID=A0A2T6AZ07_9RHOB|nr:AlpA family phage regulatory protein [Gemmobacter caeni]PTX49046.1 AlpA family transcriptional regulator [Gemmobacter caeni]TWI98953.1 AlpA family transcriptional regulator [Gemmobacter caeni]
MFLRIGEVIKRTGLARSTIYQMAREGRFPPPRRISYRVSAWVEGEIVAWQEKFVKG